MNGLSLILARDLNDDEYTSHLPEILACFKKYVERFPDQETLENIVHEIYSGKRELWLVLDENGEVILTPITEILTLPTGKKYISMVEVGGERLQDALPMLEQIEQWAVKNHDVVEAQFPGRTGYRKLLPEYGYKEKIVIFTKKLENENNV